MKKHNDKRIDEVLKNRITVIVVFYKNKCNIAMREGEKSPILQGIITNIRLDL